MLGFHRNNHKLTQLINAQTKAHVLSDMSPHAFMHMVIVSPQVQPWKTLVVAVAVAVAEAMILKNA